MTYRQDTKPGIVIDAERLGWMTEYSQHSGWSFERRITGGTRRVWRMREGWQCADIINNRYCNHRAKPLEKGLTIEEALNMTSNEPMA